MVKDYIPAAGALPSKKDIRTFTAPVTAAYIQSGGARYEPEDIEDQAKVGICTAISLTQNAKVALGTRFSADFQYLMQKRIYDGNWTEGSSILHALKVGRNIGFLPEDEWDYTTQEDREGSYADYIAKLKAVPDAEIQRLTRIAGEVKIKAFAAVPVDRDALAEAIATSDSGILARFDIGKEWWSSRNMLVTTWNKDQIEPLRSPRLIISGHAVTESNFDGGSFRVANSWGDEWADNGTAYHLLKDYAPTEAWRVWYEHDILPKVIDEKLDIRSDAIGKIMDLLQQVLELLKIIK